LTNLKNAYLLLFILFVSFYSCKESPEPEHFVWEGEMTIQDTFRIEKGNSLTIKPGSKITFAPAALIVAWGDITAIGTPEARIQLIAKDPIKDHRIIQTKSECKKLHVHHADIKDGVITSYMTDNHFKDVHFSNSKKLRWNDAMTRFWWGKVLFEDCVADWNNQGEGILIHKTQSPLIKNCTFNQLPDAVEFLHVKNGLITDCIFNNNNDDAVDFNHCFKSSIENCEFYNTRDCALELGSQKMGSSDSLTVKNCLFVDCKIAVNLKESSMAEVSNSSFYNNGISLDAISHVDSTKHTQLFVDNSVVIGGEKFMTEKDGGTVMLDNVCFDKKVDKKGAYNCNATFEDPVKRNFAVNGDRKGLEAIGYQRRSK